jgi:hypothetical protein
VEVADAVVVLVRMEQAVLAVVGQVVEVAQLLVLLLQLTPDQAGVAEH